MTIKTHAEIKEAARAEIAARNAREQALVETLTEGDVVVVARTRPLSPPGSDIDCLAARFFRALNNKDVDTKEWRQNGKLHRVDGPACDPDGSQVWFQNGGYHRLDGPAYIGANGSQAWYQNGSLHRLDGPAVIWADGCQEWYQNGGRHRMDGPAVIKADGRQAWYQNHKNVTEEVHEWIEQMSIRPDWENWGDVEKVLFRLRF